MNRLKTKITGEGPDMVLLHGWSMNSEIWQPILPALEASFTVHCIDLPGHGINIDCSPGDRLEDWANAVISVMPASSTCLGWSLGGLLALAVARRQPACIERLGLIACTPKFTADQDWSWAMDAALLDDFSSGLSVNDHATLHKFIKLVALGDPRTVQLSRRLQQIVNRGGMASLPALRAGLRFLRDEDLRAVFHDFSGALWVALGDEDRLLPVDAVSGLVRLNEAVRIDIFEYCGHVPFVTYPDMFLSRLQNWLDGSH
jgi:pimeloyl-[acyl-carrier protein] methyl ester esterase